MQLTELDKIRLKRVFLRLESLRLHMWVTVLCEFYGPYSAWSKLEERFANSEMNKDVTMQDLIKITKCTYDDFSHKKPYPNRPMFLTHLYFIISIFNVHQLIRFFPIDYVVKRIEYTSKRDYLNERSTYRMSHNVAKEGNDLKQHHYKEYKHIAKKYQWPIIYNGDDLEAQIEN